MQVQEATPHILVVEDEPSMRQGIYRILTRQGLEVSTAGSGEEALSVIGAGRFSAGPGRSQNAGNRRF